MAKISFKSVYIRILLSVFLTVSVVACLPNKNGENSTPASETKLSSLDTEAATCEAQLRQGMLAKIYQFYPVAELSKEISLANQNIKTKTDQVSYSVNQQKEQVSGVGVEFFKIKEKTRLNIDYKISLAPEESNGLFTFTVAVKSILPTENDTLTQEYLVNHSCQLQLSQTINEKLVKAGGSKIDYSQVIIYLDGGKEVKNNSFNLASQEILVDFLTDTDDIRHLPQSAVSFLEGIGLVQTSIHKEDSAKKAHEFGLDLFLNAYLIDFSSQGKNLFQVYYGIDDGAQIKLTSIAKTKNWNVPQSVWTGQNLGSSKDINKSVQSLLPKDYLLRHNSIQILTKQLPSYDHFAAYWSVASSLPNEKPGLTVFNLIENSNPIISGTTSPLDLESNDTIQTELPAVQTIVKGIVAQVDLSRLPLEFGRAQLLFRPPFVQSQIRSMY